MAIRVFHGSILDVKADAIVATANTELVPGAGLAKIVATAAGPEVRHQLRLTGVTPLGHAVVTAPGNLTQFKFLIHVITRDAYMLGMPTKLTDIERGTRNALNAAYSLTANSVAFPLLGTGDVGLDRKDVVETMGKVFSEFSDKLNIILCAYTPADRDAAALLETPAT